MKRVNKTHKLLNSTLLELNRLNVNYDRLNEKLVTLIDNGEKRDEYWHRIITNKLKK